MSMTKASLRLDPHWQKVKWQMDDCERLARQFPEKADYYYEQWRILRDETREMSVPLSGRSRLRIVGSQV